MPTIANILDAKYAKRIARDYDLKVTLKKNRKGYSLYARKNIRKGNVIAYYKFKLYKYTDNFRGVKKDMYLMSAYNKNGNLIKNLIGDVYSGSLESPKYGIPFWAYFSNEPSGKEAENCVLDTNEKGNFRDRKRVKAGDTMVYKLIATRNIKAGEEVCWCYGTEYVRNYKSNCD
jgi:hypothetical protein